MSEHGLRIWLSEAERVDRAIYGAITNTPTPLLDRAMPVLSRAADHSKLWVGTAVLLAVTGGRRGRLAAASGLTSVAATSVVANLIIKPIGRRRRPDRAAERVPLERQVRMPGSRSFPSGHAASATAFASAAGRVLPAVGVALRLLAALVGYSRVHTGVHYPSDVIAGAVAGGVIADFITGPTTSKLDASTARR